LEILPQELGRGNQKLAEMLFQLGNGRKKLLKKRAKQLPAMPELTGGVQELIKDCGDNP
jgi:hypothetical protein